MASRQPQATIDPPRQAKGPRGTERPPTRLAPEGGSPNRVVFYGMEHPTTLDRSVARSREDADYLKDAGYALRKLFYELPPAETWAGGIDLTLPTTGTRNNPTRAPHQT